MIRVPMLRWASVGCVAALLGCRADGARKAPRPPVSPPATEAPIAAKKASVAPTPAAAPEPTWTPARLRTFVLETTALADRAVKQAYEHFDESQIAGECWGGPAPRLVKAGAVVPLLAERLEGRALRCYLASYFGCRIGDWLARAGVAQFGPGGVPFNRSKVAIVQQTPDRLVADIVEAEATEVLSNGELDKDKVGEKNGDDADSKFKSRYTLSRGADGKWRISDRVPSFESWECRE
jgi:hypothetical protein